MNTWMTNVIDGVALLTPRLLALEEDLVTEEE